ncbi:MAG: sensor histidine kinase [Lachnospiraceae bacterium]
MIQKLQRRYIIITMACMTAVVLILAVLIDALSYIHITSQYEDLLQILAEHDGSFPKRVGRKNPLDSDVRKHMEISLDDAQGELILKLFSFRFSEETAYETRYFSVRTAEDGSSGVDLSHIAAISEDDAWEFVLRVEESGKESGYLSHYRYLVSEKSDGVLYIFIDCQNGIQTVATNFLLTLFAGIILIVLILIPVVILSRRATQPVVDNMERQKQFITDAGHELKTPLTIISANVEVLELCSEANEWTNSIKNQVSRMNDLVSNLLMLAKMDEMAEEEEKQEVCFGKAVLAAADSFAVVAAGKQISMEKEIDTSVMVQGSQVRLNQLIMILIDNAVKYTEQGGFIKINCQKREKQIRFSVWNSCEPMPEKELSRLFERFYRREPSRSRQTGGSGIGLSAAHSIVRAHKGRITAKNQGAGICFMVQLPRSGI